MTEAWIGLGGNLGAVRKNFVLALESLDGHPDIALLAVSPAYRSAAWGQPDQPDFINAVARLETGLDAHALLEVLHEIEARLGRRRDARRWAARTIDLDLLLYGQEVLDEAGLCVPHPRLSERAFVLVPLNDLAPALVVPGRGRVDELLAALDDKEIRSVSATAPLELATTRSTRKLR